MNFIDKVTILIIAGDGGDGVLEFETTEQLSIAASRRPIAMRTCSRYRKKTRCAVAAIARFIKIVTLSMKFIGS